MAKYVGVPEPKYTITLRIQPLLPLDIALNFLGMLTAIKFDDEPMLVANEIDDEWTNWYLATKPKAVEAMATQFPPERALSVGHF